MLIVFQIILSQCGFTTKWTNINVQQVIENSRHSSMTVQASQ